MKENIFSVLLDTQMQYLSLLLPVWK